MPENRSSSQLYHEQLDIKLERVRELFRPLPLPSLEVYESPGTGYRMRAEFKIWHEGNDTYYAMFQPGEYKKPYRIDNFLPGHVQIQELMPKVLEFIKSDIVLRKKLFQAEFLTTLSGETLLTLIYHKKLDDDWTAAANLISEKLKIKIIGRSRKQKVTLQDDFVTEALTIDGRTYKYRQVEGSFTQPNATVCKKMIEWSIEKSRNLGDDLLELYCGNGNFTLPLSKNFNKVLATEISKVSVNAALHNIAINDISNIVIARMSSEEFSEAIDGIREFRRLKDINLDEYRFSTIFLDPPRAGLDPHTTEIAVKHDNILYISCNPETMARDIAAMSETHNIEAFAVFDQFPFTDHIECGALLKRIESAH